MNKQVLLIVIMASTAINSYAQTDAEFIRKARQDLQEMKQDSHLVIVTKFGDGSDHIPLLEYRWKEKSPDTLVVYQKYTAFSFLALVEEYIHVCDTTRIIVGVGSGDTVWFTRDKPTFIGFIEFLKAKVKGENLNE